MINIAHLVDDNAMGGVMVALMNFQDPRLTAFANSRLVNINPLSSAAPKLDDDIIVIHFTVNWKKLPFLMALRARNFNSRIVIIEHSYTEAFEDWNVPSKLRFRQMLRVAYATIDDVVAVSQNQAAWLKTITNAQKVKTIAQSRIFDRMSCVPTVTKKPDEPIVFGAIGRLHEQKGFDDLIASFRSLPLKNAKLLIAGDGPMGSELQNYAADCEQIEFVGRQDDPAAFYERVHSVVIPSRWEAFGLVASEAMAAGRFVIANDIDGLSEQVRGAGILVPSGDRVALIRAMQDVSVLRSRHLEFMGDASRNLALPRYDTMIEAWRDYLLKMPQCRATALASSAAARKPSPTMMSPGQYM